LTPARSELAQRLDEEKKKAEAAAQQAQERVKVLRAAQQEVAATAQQVSACTQYPHALSWCKLLAHCSSTRSALSSKF
jgi:hypothetical protein